ncbi:hypothetical protein INE82_00963 [Bacteroides thetaiotaomicron]|nr:hypothetical protein INE82_00963 [Bacteroides thetaiotaomicron]
MLNKFYTSIPTNYPICGYSDCPMAATCLHQIVYATMLENKEYIHLINPNRCNKNETCSYYRDNKPITYVRGFTNFQKQIFPEQYLNFMNRLIGKFGRNPYFERRRGGNSSIPQRASDSTTSLEAIGSNRRFEIRPLRKESKLV